MRIAERAANLLGLDLDAVGRDSLERAMDRGADRLGLPDRAAYLAILAGNPAERRWLAGQAVVQESWLMRDPDALAALARLARDLPRPVRVLCVPCARGEEPASIAAALLDAGIPLEDFLVDAADANPQALEQARAGRFGPGSVRGPLAGRSPHFRRDADDMVLSPAALARIRFFEADVLDQDFLAGEAPYPVVFCRHLLIYLNPCGRRRLVASLRRRLAPGGALFTSPSEAATFLQLGLTPCGAQSCPVPTVRLEQGPAPAPARPPAPKAAPARAAVARRGLVTPPVPAAETVAQGCPVATARALADAGQLREALEHIDAALERSGPDAELYHLRGVSNLALGNAPEAESDLRRALYLDPGHVMALTHLELLNRANGRQTEADLLAERAQRAQGADA